MKSANRTKRLLSLFVIQAAMLVWSGLVIAGDVAGNTAGNQTASDSDDGLPGVSDQNFGDGGQIMKAFLAADGVTPLMTKASDLVSNGAGDFLLGGECQQEKSVQGCFFHFNESGDLGDEFFLEQSSASNFEMGDTVLSLIPGATGFSLAKISPDGTIEVLVDESEANIVSGRSSFYVDRDGSNFVVIKSVFKGQSVAVSRYLADGSLDAAFGQEGSFVMSDDANGSLTPVAVLKSEQNGVAKTMVIARSTTTSLYKIARLDNLGVLDTTYATDKSGVSTFDLNASLKTFLGVDTNTKTQVTADVGKVVLDQSQDLYLVAAAKANSKSYLAVTKYNIDGSTYLNYGKQAIAAYEVPQVAGYTINNVKVIDAKTDCASNLYILGQVSLSGQTNIASTANTPISSVPLFAKFNSSGNLQAMSLGNVQTDHQVYGSALSFDTQGGLITSATIGYSDGSAAVRVRRYDIGADLSCIQTAQPQQDFICQDGVTHVADMVQCPVQPQQDVICSDGTTHVADASQCPVQPQQDFICADGVTHVAESSQCPTVAAESVTCADGAVVKSAGDCPVEVTSATCADGTVVKSLADCVKDGWFADKPALCPDGSKPNLKSGCNQIDLSQLPVGFDDIVGSCSDGSVSLDGKCPGIILPVKNLTNLGTMPIKNEVTYDNKPPIKLDGQIVKPNQATYNTKPPIQIVSPIGDQVIKPSTTTHATKPPVKFIDPSNQQVVIQAGSTVTVENKPVVVSTPDLGNKPVVVATTDVGNKPVVVSTTDLGNKPVIDTGSNEVTIPNNGNVGVVKPTKNTAVENNKPWTDILTGNGNLPVINDADSSTGTTTHEVDPSVYDVSDHLQNGTIAEVDDTTTTTPRDLSDMTGIDKGDLDVALPPLCPDGSKPKLGTKKPCPDSDTTKPDLCPDGSRPILNSNDPCPASSGTDATGDTTTGDDVVTDGSDATGDGTTGDDQQTDQSCPDGYTMTAAQGCVQDTVATDDSGTTGDDQQTDQSCPEGYTYGVGGCVQDTPATDDSGTTGDDQQTDQSCPEGYTMTAAQGCVQDSGTDNQVDCPEGYVLFEGECTEIHKTAIEATPATDDETTPTEEVVETDDPAVITDTPDTTTVATLVVADPAATAATADDTTTTPTAVSELTDGTSEEVTPETTEVTASTTTTTTTEVTTTTPNGGNANVNLGSDEPSSGSNDEIAPTGGWAVGGGGCSLDTNSATGSSALVPVVGLSLALLAGLRRRARLAVKARR